MQEQLAARAGLHRTEVGLLERSGRTCQVDTLIRLAEGAFTFNEAMADRE